MNLNVRQIKALVSIAKLSSFTKAADLLHVSQPALTQQIHQLEDVLGGRLFDRNTRSVRLTQLGHEVVPLLEGVLRDIDAVMARTNKLASRTTGVVSIAALPSVCETMLPEVISQFLHEYPGISIRLRDGVSPRIVAHVKADEVDFGIGSIDNVDPEIQVTPLIDDPMCAVFPSGHALEQKKVIELKDLAGLPLIEFEADRNVRRLVDRAFESIGHMAVADYEASYICTALGMVKAGLGVAILPSLTVDAAAVAGIEARIIQSPGLIRSIQIMQKSGRSLSTAADSFLKAIDAAADSWRSSRPLPGRRNRPSDRDASSQSQKTRN